jgi:hypothetical protein
MPFTEFRLSAPGTLSADQAHQLVTEAHNLAATMHAQGRFEAVCPVWPPPDDRRAGIRLLWFRAPGQLDDLDRGPVWPAESFLFRVRVGKNCGLLSVGLCRYLSNVRYKGRTRPTRLTPDWHFRSLIATHYASLHGWDYFLRCHAAVIDFLDALRGLGFRVRIKDECGYWPGRSVSTLRSTIDRFNSVLAASAGLFLDSHEPNSPGTHPNSPSRPAILRHPQFEHLEAEGVKFLQEGFARLLRPPNESEE